MLGVVIVLILMVMGGIIAFLGDKIGSKVGKRRLTMFGLRPKYTSIIITIVSGVLISFLTVAVMTVVNENVRIALFGLNKLKAEMNELNLQIETKNKQLAEGKLLLAKRTDEYNEINQRANSIFEELNDVEQQKASVEAELSLVQDAYNQARQDIDASAEEIKSLEQTKNELSGNIEKLKGVSFEIREGEILGISDASDPSSDGHFFFSVILIIPLQRTDIQLLSHLPLLHLGKHKN